MPTPSTTKKALTLNLSDAEMEVLEKLSASKQISKTAVIRQALRLYQVVDHKRSTGEDLYFENGFSKAKSQLILV